MRQEKEMPHPVVHFEIGCEDSASTQDFYRKLFGWKIDAMGPAAMIAAEAGGITGHITAVEHGAATLQKANSLGAKPLVPPTDIPAGTFAWMQDPAGNTVGLWKPKQ